MTGNRLNVAIIGCGLIGRRRAACATACPETRLSLVIDREIEAARALATEYGCKATNDWLEAITDDTTEIVAVATPNAYLSEIAIAALAAGKHVLVEKPMGRNLAEALKMADAAKHAKRLLKIGFNHRYHPGLARAHELLVAGEIGEIINLRARYGHGGRPGYEREWRGDPEIAGGGELTDQGVHVADLVNWFAGAPDEAFALTQTAVWPIAPLEDNAFGLFRFANGAIASFHTSWTQWKNLFSFEVFGRQGSLTVEGLGGSYGVERLVIAKRKPEGGVPSISEEIFDGVDRSWELEWADFISAIKNGTKYLGTPGDGLVAMQMLAALYESAASGGVSRIETVRGPGERFS